MIFLKKENGKSLTVKTFGANVVLTVWRKSGAPLLPLEMNRMEAQNLRNYLQAAIDEASKAAKEAA